MVALEELTDKNRSRLLAAALQDFKSDTESMVLDLEKLDLDDWEERWVESSVDYTCTWSKYLSTDMSDCIKWLQSKDVDFRDKVLIWLKKLLPLFGGDREFDQKELKRLNVIILEIEKI